MEMHERRVISQWRCQPTEVSNITVLPDGCRDVLLTVTADQQLELILTGLDRHSYRVEAQAGTYFYGLRMAPGMRLSGERSPQTELLQLQQPGLLNKLQEVVEQPELIEQTLLEWLDEVVQPPESLLNEFVCSVSEYASLAGLSERSLRRRVTRASGAPPSFWHGLYRARGVAKALCQNIQQDVCELAYQWGYADQSHLCRDMRRWFAQTPAGLRRQAKYYLPSLSSEDAFYR